MRIQKNQRATEKNGFCIAQTLVLESIFRHLEHQVSTDWCAMKKILSKFEKNERTDNSNSSGTHQREASCFIGKVFTVGRTVVTVEDVLAEG